MPGCSPEKAIVTIPGGKPADAVSKPNSFCIGNELYRAAISL